MQVGVNVSECACECKRVLLGGLFLCSLTLFLSPSLWTGARVCRNKIRESV